MTVSEEGKRRRASHSHALVDIELAVDVGVPRDAFDDDGYLDVERLAELGFSIEPDGTFTPPMDVYRGSAHFRRATTAPTSPAGPGLSGDPTLRHRIVGPDDTDDTSAK